MNDLTPSQLEDLKERVVAVKSEQRRWFNEHAGVWRGRWIVAALINSANLQEHHRDREKPHNRTRSFMKENEARMYALQVCSESANFICVISPEIYDHLLECGQDMETLMMHERVIYERLFTDLRE